MRLSRHKSAVASLQEDSSETYSLLDQHSNMDKLSLPFVSPVDEADAHGHNREPTISLLKLNHSKKGNRKLPSSLLELANSKRSSLLSQDSQTQTPSTSITNDVEADVKNEQETSLPKSIPMSAYFLLASAVVSLSFIAPLLDLQEGDPIMKIVWRHVATAILLAAFAASTFIQEGSFGVGAKAPSAKGWVYAILAGVFYSPCCTTFSVSLDYTTVEDAVAFSNAQGLIILIGKVFLGYAVSLRQSVGALVAFGGVVFCNLDSDQMMEEEYSTNTTNGDASATIEELDARVLYGDMLSFACALFGVGYLLLSNESRKEVSLYPFMFVVMLAATVVSIITAVALGKPIEVWSLDEDWGAFGFLHLNRFDRFPLEVICVTICNILGTMGYVRALRYFDPLVVSVAALSEPVVAQFLAALAQVGMLPGWRGWIGNALIAMGTYWVAYEPPTKKEEKDAFAYQSPEKTPDVGPESGTDTDEETIE